MLSGFEQPHLSKAVQFSPRFWKKKIVKNMFRQHKFIFVSRVIFKASATLFFCLGEQSNFEKYWVCAKINVKIMKRWPKAVFLRNSEWLDIVHSITMIRTFWRLWPCWVKLSGFVFSRVFLVLCRRTDSWSGRFALRLITDKAFTHKTNLFRSLKQMPE